MDSAFVHSIWTVILLLVFIGIVYWAFVHKRSSDFDRAARMPLEDEAGKDGKNQESGDKQGPGHG